MTHIYIHINPGCIIYNPEYILFHAHIEISHILGFKLNRWFLALSYLKHIQVHTSQNGLCHWILWFFHIGSTMVSSEWSYLHEAWCRCSNRGGHPLLASHIAGIFRGSLEDSRWCWYVESPIFPHVVSGWAALTKGSQGPLNDFVNCNSENLNFQKGTSTGTTIL